MGRPTGGRGSPRSARARPGSNRPSRREANGWVLPPGIEAALDAWRFDRRSATIAEVRTVLEARDDLAVAAAVAGLELPPNLRATFEAGDLEAATAEARGRAGDRRPARGGPGRRGRDVVVVAGSDRPARARTRMPAARGGAGPRSRRRPQRGPGPGDRRPRGVGRASDLGGLRLRSILALLLVVALAALLMATRKRRHPRRARVGYESEIG